MSQLSKLTQSSSKRSKITRLNDLFNQFEDLQTQIYTDKVILPEKLNEKMNPQKGNQIENKNIKIKGDSPSKAASKPTDLYDPQPLDQGIFKLIDQVEEELKIINTLNSSTLKNKSLEKKSKLAPIQLTESVTLLTQNELNQNSRTYQLSKNLSVKKDKVTNIKSKQIRDLREFAVQSIPVNKRLVAVIKRDRSGTKRFFPKIDLFLNEDLKFLMHTKRKSCYMTSTHHMGFSNEPVEQLSDEYVGTVKSNFFGSEYNLIDNSKEEKQIIATIFFQGRASCNLTPRQVQVYILSPFYKFEDLQGSDPNKLSLNLRQLYDIGQNKTMRKVLKFVNKKPQWDEEKEVWCLDFYGKALYSSVKNTILIDAQDEKKEVIILGKSGENIFNFEVMFPFSPRIAMAFATASLDWKWASQ